MGLYNIKGIWYYELYVDGKRIRKSTGKTNRRAAEDMYAKARAGFKDGWLLPKDEGRRKTFKDMADKYMTEYAVKKVPKSIKRDKIFLKHLLPVFGNMYLAQIKPAQIVEYKNQRRNEGVSAKTINHELGFCKHAFNLAIREWEWTTVNPFARISMEKLPQPRVRYLTHEEFKRLYQACSEVLKPIVLLAVYTGMRQDNILSLTWQQVDLSRGEINLEHTKNGERLVVPMNETIKQLLTELKKVRHISSVYVFHYSTGSRLNASDVGNWFRRTCQREGIQDFRFHDLRHTFASWLIQKGVSLYEVQRLLGHKTGEMTRRYAHLAPDNLKTAVNTLDGTGNSHKTAIVVDNERLTV